MEFFITTKITDYKRFNSRPPYRININYWFKSNGLTLAKMNKVRLYLFEEWIETKIQNYKERHLDTNLVFVYNKTTDNLIEFLKEKIYEGLDPDDEVVAVLVPVSEI